MRARRIHRRDGAAHSIHRLKPTRAPAHFIANLAACVKAGTRAFGEHSVLGRGAGRAVEGAPSTDRKVALDGLGKEPQARASHLVASARHLAEIRRLRRAWGALVR